MTVRLAVAGAGLIGQRHVEEIDPSPSATLAAIVDPFPAAAEVAAKFSARRPATASTHPIPRWHPWKRAPFYAIKVLPGQFRYLSWAAGRVRTRVYWIPPATR